MSLDRTLIQIRERSYLDVLDLALVVIRGRPVVLGLAAVAGVVPFAVLNQWLITVHDIPRWLFYYLLLLEAPWATAPLTVVLGALMFDERPTFRKSLRSLVGGLPSLIVHQLLLRSLAVFVYPFVFSRLVFLNEVILLERGPLLKTVGRSSNLAGKRGSELFAQWMGNVAFGLMFLGTFWLGVGAIYSALVKSEVTWEYPGMRDVSGFRLQFTLWLMIVFFAVVRFLTYIDQRIRLEGWEINLRLQAIGRSMGEGGR